jgi:hypothetical protein
VLLLLLLETGSRLNSLSSSPLHLPIVCLLPTSLHKKRKKKFNVKEKCQKMPNPPSPQKNSAHKYTKDKENRGLDINLEKSIQTLYHNKINHKKEIY